MNPDIIAKLQKILARADTSRGATIAEAEAAMTKAQQIAIENNIDLASVSLNEPDAKIETDRADVGGETATRRPHHPEVVQVLNSCFDVTILWLGTGSRISIIGEKTDVAIACYCWTWLCGVYPQLFRNFLASAPPSSASEGRRRAAFYRGLTVGLMVNNERQKAAAKASCGDAYSLVLVRKEDAIEARAAQEFPHARKARKARETDLKSLDRNALVGGYNEGKKIKLGGALAAA